MDYVVFKNKGELDMRAVRTFGMSAKENDNPIGYFGTGLKYAIAIALRNNCEFQILSGRHSYKLHSAKVSLRGKSFDNVMMNSEELAFTTELGKNWDMWQAFREVYCNCIDEGGETFLVDKIPRVEEGFTQIVVDGAFVKHFHDRHEIVLPKMTVVASITNNVEMCDVPSKHIYYRSVRVGDLDKKGLFTYNFTNGVTLTEDRTLNYQSYEIGMLKYTILGCKDKKIIRKALLAPADTLEMGLNYSSTSPHHASDAFLDVMSELYEANEDGVNITALDFYVRATRKDNLKNLVSVELTQVEKLQLNRVKTVCADIFTKFRNYPILCVEDLGTTTMALADTDNRRIVLSKRCFERGTKYLLSTVIEEYMHLVTGYNDHTRELQTHLFDTICTLVENHVLKEPI